MRTDRMGVAIVLALGGVLIATAQDAKNADGQKPKANSPTTVALVGADIYTVTKGVIKNGTVLIQDGKIVKVGTEVEIPAEAKRIEAKGKCVTPGFIAVSASNLGMRAAAGAGGGGGPGQGVAGTTGRIADTLNPFDRNILFCLASGITTACVETGGGGGGRFGRDGFLELDENNVCPCCGMTFLPTEPITPPTATERTPRRHAVLRMTYGDLGPMLVKESPFYHLTAGSFVGAFNRHQWRETIKRAKQQLKDRAAADPDGDPMGGFGGGGAGSRRVPEEVLRLVEKKIALRVDAASIDQMRDMIALAKELDYPLILEGVHEAWLIPEELKQASAQAILTPRSRRRPNPGREESTGSSIETSGLLAKAGVPFAVTPLSSSVSLDGIPGRDLTSLMLEAAFAVRGGASDATAIESLTIVPARMIGLEKQIGSIEEGKDADLLLLNGPPLDYRTVVEHAYVGGKVYYDRNRDRIYADAPGRW